MAQATIDELRFFLDGREDLAPRVQAIGATVTDLMVAISAEDAARTIQMSERAKEVSVLLEDSPIVLTDDDVEALE